MAYFYAYLGCIPTCSAAGSAAHASSLPRPLRMPPPYPATLLGRNSHAHPKRAFFISLLSEAGPHFRQSFNLYTRGTADLLRDRNERHVLGWPAEEAAVADPGPMGDESASGKGSSSRYSSGNPRKSGGSSFCSE